MALTGAQKLSAIGLFLVVAGVSACSLPKGVKLEQLKGQYEDIGRVSARAIQCNISVPVHMQELTDYAKSQGASDQEAESLVSYHDAAMVEARKNTEACLPEEKSRVQQELADKMKAVKP
jgi:hypothetical protein